MKAGGRNSIHLCKKGTQRKNLPVLQLLVHLAHLGLDLKDLFQP